MKNFYVEPTLKTPEINFNTNGEFYISGNSYPENVTEFYEKAVEWLESFFNIYKQPVSIDINLKYINTSSTKVILTIINKISESSKSKIKVRWIYEIDDEDMYATGEDLQSLTNLKFDFVTK